MEEKEAVAVSVVCESLQALRPDLDLILALKNTRLLLWALICHRIKPQVESARRRFTVPLHELTATSSTICLLSV